MSLSIFLTIECAVCLDAYRAPKWVKDLEVKKAKTADMSPKVRIRDPEKLSFKEKLQLFL